MNSRRTRLQSALAVITTVLVLVPAGVLFTRVWQENSKQRDRTESERQGVEYLTALTPLISSLTEAQSTALQGVSEPPGSLSTAVSAVTAVDARLGDTLETRQRWTGLQDRIGKLAKLTGNPVTIYQSYAQATDLALALYVAVRRNSELNQDPDNDVANLQQAVAVDMPTTVVRVGRMGDLANLLQAVPAATRARLAAQFGQEVLAVQESVNRLTDNLQAAVDTTSNSGTLSGSLVTTLDSFRRGVEAMTRGANPGGVPNAATISTAQSTLQTALSSLAGVSLKEMDRLLTKRLDTLDRRRIEALAAAAAALLLVLLAVLLPALAGRRKPEPAAPPAPAPGESTRDVVLNRPGPGGYGSNPSNPYDQAPVYGEGNPTSRERSGALR
jgi:hypothetical protein